MSLSREIYSEFEAIVGSEHISDKPHVLAGNRAKTPDYPLEYKSAEAIIRPGSVEELQAVVKLCNKYGIVYAPMVSGVMPTAFATHDNTVILQLSRMNRIVEINEEDRYVIIEPGVRHVQLYPELRKRGFSYTAASVGPGGSVLANFTSTSGDHHTQYGNSRANRYLLGVEMILPDGEIIRTGSLQTDSGWFCPDGPGPGLRGIVKGYCGNHAQFGIITRIAIAIDPCKGPAELDMGGVSPHHHVRMNTLSKVYVYKFDNLDDLRDAMLRLGEAEIGSTVLKYFYLPATLMMTDSANHFWQKWEEETKEELRMTMVVHLAPRSEAELEYEETILREITSELGGVRIKRELEQWWEEHMDFFMIVSRLQSVLRLGGGWAPIKLASESLTHICEVGKNIGSFITKYTETGKIFDAPEDYQIIPMEYGHFAHIELLFMWDRDDPAAMKGVGEFRAECRQSDLDKNFHGEMPNFLSPAAMELGPLYSNFHIWLKQLKEAFDPRNVARPML